MLTFSAVSPAPYAPDDVFSPDPTYSGAAVPDYGFYFAATKNTATQCIFDNCSYFDQFCFKDDIEKASYLLLRYEILYKHKAGRLADKYYIVPWILLPATIAAPGHTVELEVTPYSIYDPERIPKELRDEIKKLLEQNNRQIELTVSGSSGIKAYWGTSGTDVTIEEKKLVKGQKLTIKIPAGQYVGSQDIERQYEISIISGATVLGKIRLTFCAPLRQDVCFIKVSQPIADGPFEARILPPSQIPNSWEDQTPALDRAVREDLRPYCIDIVSIDGAEFLDAGGKILISATTTLPLGSDLKPPADLSVEEKKKYVDAKFSDQLFSKMKEYTQQGVVGGRAPQKVIVVILLSFWFSGPEGFTHAAKFVDGRLLPPRRCYIFPTGTRVYEEAVSSKKKSQDPSKVTVFTNPNPYLACATTHEVLHALQLGHTFADIGDGASNEARDSFVDNYLSEFSKNVDAYDLTEFGGRKAGPTPKGQNIFELMRDADLKSAAVSGYLWGVLHNPDFDPQSGTKTQPSTGLTFMTHLNENVLFRKYQTDNMMDYIYNYPVKDANTRIDGTVTIYFSAPAVRRGLLRYQWELARATVQYLSSYSP